MDNTSSRFTDNTSSRFTDNTSSRFTDNTSSRFSTHKNQQQILGGKNPRSWKTKIIHQSPQLRLSNLFALRNKLNSKSFLMVCVCFSPHFFYLYCITFIYLHLYLKSVYLSQFLIFLRLAVVVVYQAQASDQFLATNKAICLKTKK